MSEQYGVQGTPIAVTTDPLPVQPESTEPAETPATEAAAISASTLSQLITRWEDVAATTLIRSDYMQGQRDAVLGCIGDARKLLDAASA